MANSIEKQIRDIFAQQERAWNSGDASAWSAGFAENAEFINIRGTVFNGRAEIARRHAVIFSSFFRGSRDTVTLQSISWPTPEIAVVRATHDVTGHPGLPPGIQETEKGRLITRMTCVIRKTGDSTCEIVFAQNTALANKEDQ